MTMKKDAVIRYFGSQKNVAKALIDAGHSISLPAISMWGEDIPELRAFQIEQITNGALQRTPAHTE